MTKKLYIVKDQDKPVVIEADNRWTAWQIALDMKILEPILVFYK